MGNLLKSKVAVITGGGRGIGRAIAEHFASEGCSLALIARTIDELEETANFIKKKYNTSIHFYAISISDEQKVKDAIKDTFERYDRIDILINAASVLGPAGPFAEIDSRKWSDTISVNINGLFFCIKAVLPYMQKQNDGCIINFSGGGGLLPNPFFDAYSACKAAAVRITENLAHELENTGITVCAIAPGGVNTHMFEDMLAAGEEKVGSQIWDSFQKRKENGGDSIENPKTLAMFIVLHRGKELNGRTISARWDNWQKIAEHSDEIITSDIYTMRRIMPKDRGYDW